MRRLAACALCSITTACSSSEVDPPRPPPVEASIGTFRVRLEPDPLRLVVTAADGRVLFDGLPPADLPAPGPDGDPAPITGLAVREVKTTVESLYGSYQFTDEGTAWRTARRAANVKSAGELSFDAIDGAGTVAHVTVRAEADGELSVAVVPAVTAQGGGRVWASVASRCQPDDHFLGFGAQARDVDHRGTIVPIFVSEPGIGKRDDDAPTPIYFIAGTRHASSFPAPIYLSSRGYVAALDSPSRSVFGMCAEQDALRVTGEVDAAPGRTFLLRIFDGPTPKEALARSTSRFGRPRLPPRLAFAPWNDTIQGSDATRAFAKKLRDEDVPSSAIWYEDWRGGGFVKDDYKLAEEWDADPALYPGIEALAAELHEQGFASFVYFNTFVQKGLRIWDETAPNGLLVKKPEGSIHEFQNVKQKTAGMVDLTNPAAFDFVVSKLRAALALGMDGWMGDYGEWLPLDAALHDGSDPWASHNLYPQAWQAAQRAALDADDVGGAAPPKGRRLSFVRSGWLRTAPLADVVWAGDQSTDLAEDDGLPTVIPMGLGLGIVGVSTYGHDVAGYQVALRKPTDKETFFRWTEVGAWSPVMRTHHGTQPTKNWNLASDAETTQHWRRYAILHQQLLPLWESLAKHATETGTAIWRHLAIEFPDDARAWSVGDQVMVGPSLLVAPVVTAGATSKRVYLPKGATWTTWAPGGAWTAGGATVDAAAPLTEIPVFVRAGTIVPMLPDRVRTVITEAKGVVRVEDVGDDREVLVVLGPDAGASEVSGLEYALTGAASTKLADLAGATWNGAALPACEATPAAPCLATDTGRVRVFVTGPGALAAGSAKLDVKGGAPTRALTLDLRAP